jgi:hypothetical protein
MVELVDIFRQHGSAYRQKYGDRMLPGHHQALRAIEQCRMESLGAMFTTARIVMRPNTVITLVATITNRSASMMLRNTMPLTTPEASQPV